MSFNLLPPHRTVIFFPFGILVGTVLALAQTPSSAPVLSLTATTDNLVGQHDSIRIDLVRWSTNAERDQLSAAWSLTRVAAPAPAPAAGGRGGRAGRGGGDPIQEGPRTPEASLSAALERLPSVGELRTEEMAPYSLRYAFRVAVPDGGERIILITDRRLGAWNNLWRPVSGTPSNYEFSVLELHLNAKGEGEGKGSVTGKVAIDTTANTIALEDYTALPVVLRNAKHRSVEISRGK